MLPGTKTNLRKLLKGAENCFNLFLPFFSSSSNLVNGYYISFNILHYSHYTFLKESIDVNTLNHYYCRQKCCMYYTDDNYPQRKKAKLGGDICTKLFQTIQFFGVYK